MRRYFMVGYLICDKSWPIAGFGCSLDREMSQYLVARPTIRQGKSVMFCLDSFRCFWLTLAGGLQLPLKSASHRFVANTLAIEPCSYPVDIINNGFYLNEPQLTTGISRVLGGQRNYLNFFWGITSTSLVPSTPCLRRCWIRFDIILL